MPKILFKILNEEIPKEQNKEICNITKIVSHLETDQGCKRLNITTVQATTLIKLFSMLVHLHLLFTKDVWLALVAGGAGLQQEAPPRDIPFGRRRLQKSAAACAAQPCAAAALYNSPPRCEGFRSAALRAAFLRPLWQRLAPSLHGTGRSSKPSNIQTRLPSVWRLSQMQFLKDP